MTNLKFVLPLLFLSSAVSLSAQKKWFQQKNSEFGDHVKVDGTMGSNMRNPSEGVFLDFNNDGLKDFVIPSYFDVNGSPDVQILRFYKNIGNGRYKDVTDSIANPDIASGRYLIGYGDNRATVFDFNKDGKLDMVYPNGWENQNYSNYDTRFGFVKMRDYFYKDTPPNYIESRANGGFQAPAFFYQKNGVFKRGYELFDTKTFSVDYAVQHADMNNDGFEDLLIMQTGYKLNSNNNIVDWLGGVTIWLNDGGSGFKFNHLKLVDSTNKYLFGFYDGDGTIGVADYNGDGYKDMVLFGVKAPYKARTDISQAQQDSVLWDANYITEDITRSKVMETRIYLSDRGTFSGSNYIVVPGLRGMFSQGTDLNNDGKTDILAIWKNYRAGGFNGVYTDSISNRDGVNNQYYAYINNGNNTFTDQTKTYFPYDSTKFSRLGRGDFYLTDLDGDGHKDFIPLVNGDDTLRDQYGTFAIDFEGSHSTVYFKNMGGQYFKKSIIDSFPRVLNWKNYPILKNIDSMYSQFYGKSNPQLFKDEYLLDELYYLNNIYVEDLNNDGKNEIIGLNRFNNGINGFLNLKYNYIDSLKMPVGFSIINQCETPRLNSYIQAVCGTDTLTNRTIKVTNFNSGDSIIWNYNGNISKATSDSFKVKELGWVVATKKDTYGCVSYSSDTLYIKKSPKPVAPRVYGTNNIMSDPNNICRGDTVNLAADPQDLSVSGTILWFDKSKQLTPTVWGGVKTIYENSGSRNISTTSKIQIDSARNVYSLLLSDEGCYSDTSNFFTINYKLIKTPVLTKDASNNLTATANGNIIWYRFGVMLPDTTSTIKLTSSGSYAAIASLNGCVSALSAPYLYSLVSTPITQTKWFRGSQIDLRGDFYKTFDPSNNYYYGSSSQDQTLGLGNWFSLDKSIITDFDKDGFDDLIVTSDMVYDAKGSQGIQFLRFFQNTKNNNFKEVTKSMSDNVLPIFNMNNNLNLFDYNKDGVTDIFSFGTSEEDILSTINITTIKNLIPNNFISVNNIFGGTQKFIFQRPFFYTSDKGKFKESSSLNGLKDIYFLFNAYPYGGAVIDFNKDGFSDVIIAGSSFIKYDNANNSVIDLISGLSYSNIEQSIPKLKNGFIVLKNESGNNGLSFSQGVDLSDNISEKNVGKVYRPFQIRPDAGKNVYVADFNNDGYNDMLMTGSSMDMVYKTANDSINNNSQISNKKHEARVYINTLGTFTSSNFVTLPYFSYTSINLVDYDNDGKVDIIGMVPVTTDNQIGDTLNITTSQIGVYKNNGDFIFKEVSVSSFPKEKTKQYIISNDNPPGGRNSVMTYDIDKDGYIDIAPLSYRNDCYIINGQKSGPCVDFGWFNDDPTSFYYRNIGGSTFEKVSIGKYFSKNIFNEQPFFSSKSNDLYKILGGGQNGFPNSDSLLNQLYATNKIIPHDFNNDGKTDFLTLNPKTIKFSNLELGGPYANLETVPIVPWPDNGVGAFVISQCESPKFDKTQVPICGTDTLKPFTLSVTNMQAKDSIYWVINGKLDLTQSSSKQISDSGWVYAYKKDSTGCIAYGDTVFIKRQPKPAIPKLYMMGGNTTICQGDSSMLYADPIAMNGYIQWYKNDTAFVNPNNGARAYNSLGGNLSKRGSFAAKQSGTYKVRFVSIDGCISDDPKNDYTLTLPPIVVVANPPKSVLTPNKDTVICSGTAFSIKSSITTGIQWYKNNQLVNNANSGTLIVDTSGFYKVISINSNSNCKNISSDSIFIKYNITPSAPTLSRDTANNLVANTNGITWFKDGTSISDTTQKFKPGASGSYTAKTTQNSCISASSVAYYYLVTDIINLSSNEFIKLAPNPFKNQVNFDFFVKGYHKLNMDIYDIATGAKQVSKQNLIAGIPIYLGELSAGTYLIKVTSNDNKIVYQFKMIKM